MPLFEYRCKNCQRRFTALVGVVADAKPPACPSCKSTGLTKLMSRVSALRSEDALLDALARLHAARKDGIAEGSRLVGMFRAHGVLAPVWDLPVGTGAAVLEEPVAAFYAALQAALADSMPLSAEVRSARAGLANRQVTIR